MSSRKRQRDKDPGHKDHQVYTIFVQQIVIYILSQANGGESSKRSRRDEEVKVEPRKSTMCPELADVDEYVNEPVWCLKKAQEEKPSRQCPYLDSIDRFIYAA